MPRSLRAAVGLLSAAAVAVGVAAVGTVGPAAAADGTKPQASWHADQARVPEARAAGRGGAGVVVAVLDSWVDAAHRDFEGRVLTGADCVGGSCRPGPAPRDDCDHGTHVAGTVASSSYGVAPRATVLPVRVLSYDAAAEGCVGRPADVAAGIRWAVANGARVVNLSLGPDEAPLVGSSTAALPRAVAEAARAGVLVVFSAGNTGLAEGQRYGDDALVVAATGPTGALASYSQPGDLAAPGGDPATPDSCSRADCVASLYPGNGYSVAAGTSMAAPHVAGVAALLLGQDGARTREQVVERLRSTVRGDARLIDARAALGVPGDQTSSQADTAPQPVASRAPTPRTPSDAASRTRPGSPPATSSGGVAEAPALPPGAPAGDAATSPDVAPPQVAPAPPATLALEPAAAATDLPSVPLALAGGLVVAAGAATVAGARARPRRV